MPSTSTSPSSSSTASTASSTVNFDSVTVGWEFGLACLGIFVFGYLQSLVQTFASERVARDMRRDLAAKISTKEYAYIEKVTPAKLLTNLTSDIDSVKTFVSMAIASIISSLFIIVGASVLLLMINWKLALCVMLIIPLIMGMFTFVMSRVRKLFRARKSR
jgi:ATP-binding cassette subfamily B protein